MKYLIFFCLIGTLNSFVFAQSLVETDKNWKLVPEKSDEFNSTQIDHSKWNHQLWFGCSSEIAFVNGANVEQENGLLKILVKEDTREMSRSLNQCTKGIYHKTSDAILSNFTVGKDTYVEFRVKLVNSKADLTSAIWLSDKPIEANNPNLEIDLLETLKAGKKPKEFTSTLHVWYNYGDYNPKNFHLMLDKVKRKSKKNLSADFHVLGLERKDNFLRMYLDNELYWEREMMDFPLFLDQERRIIVNVEGHNGKEKKGNYPKELLLDYIRVYEYEP